MTPGDAEAMAAPTRLEHAAGYRVIGVPMKRKEDHRLLTGRGKYAADVRVPGLLYAAVLRSPHPHARIGAIRAGAARAVPGVAADHGGRPGNGPAQDRKSTRLNSSHLGISYAVF